MRVAILLLFFLLNGCFDQRAFEPPLPDYKLWKMSGMTDVDIKKIRLECGALSARDDGGLRTLNETALVHMCIANAGFERIDFKGRVGQAPYDEWCRNWPDLPACQPGAEIPEPSVERRLNSRYCRIRTSFQACFENSMIARTEWCESLEYPYVRNGVNWAINWSDHQACLDAEKKIATERCETRNYNKPPAECLP